MKCNAAAADCPVADRLALLDTGASHGDRMNLRLTLQLAGRRERETGGLAGRLFVAAVAAGSRVAAHTLVAPIQVDTAAGRLRIADPECVGLVPLALRERMLAALETAWRTGMNVDLVDEEGAPLLLGAIYAHPAGVSRWLIHYLQDGR